METEQQEQSRLLRMKIRILLDRLEAERVAKKEGE
jgi:hypothetical protein